MIRILIAAAALSLLPVSQASAWNDFLNSVWGPKGNETGGIIPWSPANEARAFDIATYNCKRWRKYPLATSIHRVPGDYIAYKCVWDPPTEVVRYRRHDVRIDK